MKAAELCPLSDLRLDECAHCRHRYGGGPNPDQVETLTELGAGYPSRGGVRVELGATFDSIIARWTAPQAGECGLRGCPIRPGDVVGRDSTGVLVCTGCLSDLGALKHAGQRKGRRR